MFQVFYVLFYLQMIQIFLFLEKTLPDLYRTMNSEMIKIVELLNG